MVAIIYLHWEMRKFDAMLLYFNIIIIYTINVWWQRRWEKAMVCKLIKCWYEIQLLIGDHHRSICCMYIHFYIYYSKIPWIKHITCVYVRCAQLQQFGNKLFQVPKINLYYFIGQWCAYWIIHILSVPVSDFLYKISTLLFRFKFENIYKYTYI